MSKNRLEAFSDGVIAIIITIMVLELKVPHSAEMRSLLALWPIFLSYVLSFIFLGIYWNNHHHMMQAVRRVTGRSLWANLHLLFWLSLVPFVTSWMGENHFAAAPAALYGGVLLGAACAYWLLQRSLIKAEGPDCLLARAIGSDWKGKLSPILYLVAVGIAFFAPLVSCLIYLAVAIIWLVPDPRIERTIEGANRPTQKNIGA